MPVDFVSPVEVEDILRRVEEARSAGESLRPDSPPNSTEYWQEVFEANAASVLAALSRVHLQTAHIVRYCFYGREASDLLVRPFVARRDTEVSAVRALIDWHPAPDSIAPAMLHRPTRDIDFLYRYFTFEHSAVGYFEYWVAMQELWASARWVHSRVIADSIQFDAVTTDNEWRVDQKLERYEPAVITDEEKGAQLAVLLYGRLKTQTITLHRIQIGADQGITFLESIPVAYGPRGYLA